MKLTTFIVILVCLLFANTGFAFYTRDYCEKYGDAFVEVKKGTELGICVPKGSTCPEGWAAMDVTAEWYEYDHNYYHMMEGVVCHQEWNTPDKKSFPPIHEWANRDLVSKKDYKEHINKPCSVKNQNDLKKILEFATGTYIMKSAYMVYDNPICYDDNYNPDQDTCSYSWTDADPSWAFEHTCTVGVDEFDNKSNLNAKYRFDKNGKIERQVYNKTKNEWGANSPQSGAPAKWVKDGWAKDSTGWCADPETHCIINKQIKVENGVKLTQPIVIQKQEQPTWPFRIEIKYTGQDKPSFPGISYEADDPSIDGLFHEFIVSGFNLKKGGWPNRTLPIFGDISQLTLAKPPIKNIEAQVIKDPSTPLVVPNPFLDMNKAIPGKHNYPPETCYKGADTDGSKKDFCFKPVNVSISEGIDCNKYGFTACYKIKFFYTHEDTTRDYKPDWIGVYKDNDFQFAACTETASKAIYDCDKDVILISDATYENGYNQWSSKMIVPANLIENYTKYTFIANEIGHSIRSFGDDADNLVSPILFVRTTAKSPLICPAGQFKLPEPGKSITELGKLSCITNDVCLSKNGAPMGSICKICATDETSKNGACIKTSEINECTANDRVWDDTTNTCGACKPSLKDISGECVDTTIGKADCEKKAATNGKWTYNSANNACTFSCNSGYKPTEGTEGVCQINCTGFGMVPNAAKNACTCDTANHWTQSGTGCMCEAGYTVSGNICVQSGPAEQDECSEDSECDDDELCDDGECKAKEPQPFKGDCESNGDCAEGMICSPKNECVCDSDNDWVINDAKDGCRYDSQTALETNCALNGGEYLNDLCIYNKTQIACLKSEGKWEDDLCWHDLDGDGVWEPDIDLPQNNASKSGCGCNVNDTSLPQDLASILPYLVLLGALKLGQSRLRSGRCRPR